MNGFWLMFSPSEWVAAVVGALGLIGGSVGFFTARSADKKARVASQIAANALAESATSAEKAAAAAERSAAALEEANRLFAESRREPLWAISWKGSSRFFLINQTKAIARDVEIAVNPDSEQAHFSLLAQPDGGWTVAAGASLECKWYNVDQSSDRMDLTVSWQSASSLERLAERKALIRP